MLSIESCARLFPGGLNTQQLPAFKELNARFTKGFALGGLDLTGYLDVRNLLNFRNGALGADGELDLTFGGLLDRRTGCGSWVSSRGGATAAANCIHLIRAEQRFGDGDGIYTVEEQSAAIHALYDVARGEHQQLGVGRRARIGFQIDF